MKVDYIIVGFGLSGIAFCEQLEQKDKSYVVFDDESQQASRVAGGLYNPVVLKRFTPVWGAAEQLPVALDYYSRLEKLLDCKLRYDLPILRRFYNIEEQNLWFEASDQTLLKTYLSTELVSSKNPHLSIPYRLGKVENTGRIDIQKALNSYQTLLRERNRFFLEGFDYKQLQLQESKIIYKEIEAKHIVFSEGFGMVYNPFFNNLPLVGNKGEYLIIKSKNLQLKEAIKFSLFLIPLGKDLYKVGATYNNQQRDNEPTLSAKDQILRKLQEVIKTNFTVVDHVAGIRPTVKDRRPLLGTHPKYKNMHLFNGMGSRGILTAPWAAVQLFQHIENRESLLPELNISRFLQKS